MSAGTAVVTELRRLDGPVQLPTNVRNRNQGLLVFQDLLCEIVRDVNLALWSLVSLIVQLL